MAAKGAPGEEENKQNTIIANFTPQSKNKEKTEETNQEFLNFGTFSSFEVSAAINLDTTAQPLHCMEKHILACKD